MLPTAIQHTNTTHSTATIEWRISAISYTPESYYVEYGTNVASLNQQSSTATSGSDLTVTNQIYSVVITELLSNITYYYRLVSTNSFTSTRSYLNTFVTVSVRKFIDI